MNLRKLVGELASGRKRREEDNHNQQQQTAQPKPSETSSPSPKKFRTFTLGTNREGKECGVFKQDRVHTAVFGFPGTGKSTFLLSQIIQHVQDRDGFCLLDPHGDLAKKVLSFIPKDQWDKVVYIDPMTAFHYGSVVKINFLEHGGELDRNLVARSFMDSLAKIYTRFWGPRLDMILLNALYVLMEQDEVKLSDLYSIIADEKARDRYLRNVTDPKVVTFWQNEYKRMPKDASSAVLTKVYRIIQEKIITPMFDCYKSSINFRKLLDDSNYVIVNLGEGLLTSDLSNFLGSLILSRIYIAGMSREDTPEEKRVPHYLYIDEAHRFTSTSTKDILEALRKYKVYATIASQYLEQYPKEIAKSIPSLCDTMVCFRVGKETAQTLEEFFQPYYNWENIVALPNYWFTVSTKVKGMKETTALKTINLKHKQESSTSSSSSSTVTEDNDDTTDKLIKKSLTNYGKTPYEDGKSVVVDKEGEDEGKLEDGTRKKSASSSRAFLSYPNWFDPVSWFLLTLLFFEMREWSQGELLARLLTDRGIARRETDGTFNMLLSDGYISYRESVEKWVEKKIDDENGGEVATTTGEVLKEHQARRRYYRITRKGMQQFRDTPVGQRGGADAHIIMIRRQTDLYRRMGYFCFIDKGVDPGVELPDILVYPYAEIESNSSGGKALNPGLWDTPHRFAVEVESEPEKHPERVHQNWKKNKRLGLPTIFVVNSENRHDKVKKILEENGVKIVPNILEEYFAGNAQVDMEPIRIDDDDEPRHDPDQLPLITNTSTGSSSSSPTTTATTGNLQTNNVQPVKPDSGTTQASLEESPDLGKAVPQPPPRTSEAPPPTTIVPAGEPPAADQAAESNSLSLESAMERIRQYQREGFSLKVKKRGERLYLYARRREHGKKKDEYIGAVEGSLREALCKTAPDLLDDAQSSQPSE